MGLQTEVTQKERSNRVAKRRVQLKALTLIKSADHTWDSPAWVRTSMLVPFTPKHLQHHSTAAPRIASKVSEDFKLERFQWLGRNVFKGGSIVTRDRGWALSAEPPCLPTTIKNIFPALPLSLSSSHAVSDTLAHVSAGSALSDMISYHLISGSSRDSQAVLLLLTRCLHFTTNMIHPGNMVMPVKLAHT